MPRLLILVCLLSACARRVPPPPTAGVGTTTPWGRHPGADVCFPTTAPVGWRFVGTNHYPNPAGLDLSWGYNDDDGTVLTVYVYPQEGPPSEGMSVTEAEARVAGNAVTDVVWAVQGSGPPMFGGPGFMLGGVQQLPLDGVTRPFGTLVMVWAADPWFVKMRVTWDDDKRPATEIISDVVGWSALPCSALRTADGSVSLLDVPPEDLPGQAR